MIGIQWTSRMHAGVEITCSHVFNETSEMCICAYLKSITIEHRDSW